MEGYGGDGESQRESQREWSQNVEWMQEMTALIFRPHYLISKMLQRSSLLPSSFSTSPPPPPPPRIHPHVIYPPLSTIEVGIFEGKEQVGKNEWLERRGAQQK